MAGVLARWFGAVHTVFASFHQRIAFGVICKFSISALHLEWFNDAGAVANSALESFIVAHAQNSITLLLVFALSLVWRCHSQSFRHVTASLSVGRELLTATSLGSKLFFAGGDTGGWWAQIDVFDLATGVWTTAILSVGRM